MKALPVHFSEDNNLFIPYPFFETDASVITSFFFLYKTVINYM